MKKITLFLMSLLISVGAMAQDYEFELIDIRSNADAMLYTNAKCTDPRWGDAFTSWDVLFDNDPRTYFHTEYANNAASEDGLDHYLRVDLGEGEEISAFKFEYTTRGGDAGYDFPQTIVIAGSNDGETYTQLGTISNGLPASAGQAYTSNVFTANNSYRYIRFMVTRTNTDRTAGADEHNYWHMSEFALYKAKRIEYVHNAGSLNRDDRGLTSFTITDGENSLTVNSIQTSAQAPVYVDKTAQKLTTKQGAILKFTDFSYTGSWMHAYAYIDYNKDFEFELKNNNNGEGEGEIVSYNYFDGNDITGTPADRGNAIGNTYYGDSKAMPAFTLPKDLPAGEYRVRIKIDWDNLDADYGASDIAANGGCQCDFTIVVEEAVGNEIAWDALNNAVDEAFALFNAVKIGTAVGSYSSSIDGYEVEFNNIVSYKNSITEETPSDEIDSYTARVREIIASFTLNMPKAGDYFRIKAIQGWNDDARYLGSMNTSVDGKTDRAEFVAEAGNNTIFYFDGQNLVSYASGHYLVNNSSFLGYNGVQTDGTKVEFRTSNNTSNRHAYNISFIGNDDATRWLYTNKANHTDAGTDCGTEGGYNFNLEPVTELPVTITSAKYATFYAPVAVEVPAGVTAHTVTINGEWATLSDAITKVPANTGVVLYADIEEATTYYFLITKDVDAISGNALRGSAATTYFAESGTYYALGLVDGKVGFYKDKFNNNRFQNNSHKAYLYVPNASQVKAFLFEGGETTAIETVETENANAPIYDLSGRRVLNAVKGGIYIQNGKKFIVK